MALFNPGVSECPICNRVLYNNDARIGTSMFINDRKDKFWRYSDSCMHKQCFMNWELRKEFIERYNKAQSNYIMNDDGTLTRIKKWWHILLPGFMKN